MVDFASSTITRNVPADDDKIRQKHPTNLQPTKSYAAKTKKSRRSNKKSDRNLTKNQNIDIVMVRALMLKMKLSPITTKKDNDIK
jgi:hypothetical protein